MFQQCLGPFTMLLVQGYFEAVLFLCLSNHVSGIPWFRKYIGYECHLFFKYVQSLIYIPKMQKKIQKKSFVFEIIPYE